MVTDAQVKAVEKMQSLLAKSGEWADEEIEELRKLANLLGIAGSTIRDIAQLRSNLEVIVAVRKFDRASAELIRTTNKLTTRIYVLTGVVLFFGAIQTLFTVLNYFKH